MTAIDTWIVAHQALLLILWPTVTALASIVYKTLDANSRAHAVFSFLASIGIDLPKIFDAIGRIWLPPNKRNGNGGSGSNGGTGGTGGAPPTPPANFYSRGLRMTFDRWRHAFISMFNTVVLIVTFAIAGIICVTAAACSSLGSLPPNTPADVTAAFDCVLHAVLAGQSVTPCVTQFGPQLVADALQLLLDSSKFTAEHPDKVEHVKAQLQHAKARLSESP